MERRNKLRDKLKRATRLFHTVVVLLVALGFWAWLFGNDNRPNRWRVPHTIRVPGGPDSK